jgi:2-isopropylmalate synthase
MERIIIFDTTLRDGEQSPGATLNIDEKIDIAKQLARLGVDVIEAGFPIASPGDFEAVRRIGQEVEGPIIAGLARALPQDVDRAWEALKYAHRPRIHVFISTSDIHLQHQFRKSRQEALQMTRDMVSRAKDYCSDVEFSPMDATRSERSFLYDVLATAVEAGATTLNIPDTVGYATPEEMYDLIRGILQNVPGADRVVISAHCHDDLGLAVANSLAAIRAGARQVECTINGIGERAGNASLEEIVMALKTRQDFYGFYTNVNTREIYKTSRMVSNYTGMVVQPNKAIVGANAFAHESGIHQDGVLKHRSTYEIMDPKDIGLTDSAIILGKHSGRHALKQRLTELGYNLTQEELDKAFEAFKALADRKKYVTDRDLEALVADEVRVPTEIWRLERIQVTTGDKNIPTAAVEMISPSGERLADAALGDGPVDAVCKAINRLIGLTAELVDFSVQAVTSGIDAVGEVTVKVRSNGEVVTGRGASTDIISASAKAYVNALNRLLAVKAANEAATAEGSTKVVREGATV